MSGDIRWLEGVDTRICNTCKWWKGERGQHGRLAWCSRWPLERFGVYMEVEIDGKPLPDKAEVGMYTYADFGCIHHERPRSRNVRHSRTGQFESTKAR